LETDAPSMPLSKEVLDNNEVAGSELEKTFNSPVNLIKIFEVLAAIRTEKKDELASQLEHNIEQLFFT